MPYLTIRTATLSVGACRTSSQLTSVRVTAWIITCLLNSSKRCTTKYSILFLLYKYSFLPQTLMITSADKQTDGQTERHSPMESHSRTLRHLHVYHCHIVDHQISEAKSKTCITMYIIILHPYKLIDCSIGQPKK